MQQYKDFLTSFVRSWNHTRSETLEILNSLTDKKLAFKPKKSSKNVQWQPLYWEFGCLARTQLVYAQAIQTGFMDFSLFHSDELPKKDQYKTLEEVRDLLEQADRKWTEAIRSKRKEEDFKIHWPGVNMNLPQHIAALIAHERLHHGQLISYFTLAGYQLPQGFKGNWAL